MVNDKRLLTPVQFFVLALILGNLINAVAAEETTLLTIQGNLIERLELLAENSSATMIISNYYVELLNPKLVTLYCTFAEVCFGLKLMCCTCVVIRPIQFLFF